MTDKLSDKEIENFNINQDDKYPVMPLRNTVLFPQQVIPIYIGRERSLKLINDLAQKRDIYSCCCSGRWNDRRSKKRRFILIWNIGSSFESI